MSSFQQTYSGVYDELYSKKNYPGEAQAVHTLLQKFSETPPQKIFSIGSGTLSHELLLIKHGYQFDCIDYSPEMVRLANEKIAERAASNISITEGNMEHIDAPPAYYDAAVALFNVVSYCSGTEGLKRMLAGVKKILKPGGIFVFDCWNGDTVKSDPPADKFAKFNFNETKLYRYTHVTPRLAEGEIDIEFEILKIKDSQVLEESQELHKTHFWTLEQYKEVCEELGLSVVSATAFPDIDKTDISGLWTMCLVVKKNN